MTVQAQNCLLKTLEEPPEYAVIILATANYESLLETIRSRSVRINFAKNTFDEVKRFIVSRREETLNKRIYSCVCRRSNWQGC